MFNVEIQWFETKNRSDKLALCSILDFDHKLTWITSPWGWTILRSICRNMTQESTINSRYPTATIVNIDKNQLWSERTVCFSWSQKCGRALRKLWEMREWNSEEHSLKRWFSRSSTFWWFQGSVVMSRPFNARKNPNVDEREKWKLLPNVIASTIEILSIKLNFHSNALK